MEDIPQYAGRYQVLNVVGSGAYSVVTTAMHMSTKKIVALKFFNREKIIENNMMKYVDTELRLFERLRHPSFPEVYDIIYDEKYIMLAMEYLPNGSMADCFESRVFFSFRERLNICIRVAEGIKYLHDRGIAHRDIKPENLVFDIDNNPKIVDLGFSVDDTNSNNLSKTFCGSPIYMAPEIIQCKAYDPIKADIWSFGITCHVFMTCEFPFKFENEAQYVIDMRNNKLDLRNKSTGDFSEILNKCLQFEPQSRATIGDILEMMKTLQGERSRSSNLPRLSLGVTPRHTIRASNTERDSPRIVLTNVSRRRIRSMGSL